MDGRLAHADADRRRRRPRGYPRAECFSDHGGAFDRWFLDAVSSDSHEWRIGGDEDIAAAAAYRTQPYSLCRAARLVFRADIDSAGPGGLDRIHHADLDRDPGREFPRRTDDHGKDYRDRAGASRR